MQGAERETYPGQDRQAAATGRILRGVVLGLAGMGIFSCGDALTKYLGRAGVPTIQIMAVSGLFSIVAIACYALCRCRGHLLVPRRWSIELPRSGVFLGVSFLSVVTFTHFPMTTVYAAIYLSPSLVALIGLFFLRERLGLVQAGLIGLGFVGALIAINPEALFDIRASAFDFATLLAYPFFFAGNMVLTRFVRDTESSESIACFPLLVQTVIVLPMALAQWQPLDFGQWAAMVGKGLATGGGFFLMSQALRQAPAAVVSPTQYFQIILGALFGLIFWATSINAIQAAGIGLILVSGYLGARRGLAAARKEATQADLCPATLAPELAGRDA